MLEWIDRDTFKIDSKLCIFNYNKMVSIGVYQHMDKENKTKLIMKTCTGDEILLDSCYTNNETKVQELKNNFIKFYKSRPGNNDSDKIKIK